MESRGRNSSAGGDTEVTVTAPRFNEAAEEAARPVVPLRPAGHARKGARRLRRPGVPFRSYRNRRPRGLALALMLAAGVALGAVIFRGGDRSAPAAPSSPETAAGAAQTAATEPTPTRPVRSDDGGAPTAAAGGTEARRAPRVRYKQEGRGWDEEKIAEHARKDEERRREEYEKRAGRDREEAEKEAERLRKKLEKGVGREARRIGIIIGEP